MFKNYYMYCIGDEYFFVEAESLQEAEEILKLENKFVETLEYMGGYSDLYARCSGLKIY